MLAQPDKKNDSKKKAQRGNTTKTDHIPPPESLKVTVYMPGRLFVAVRLFLLENPEDKSDGQENAEG